MLNNAILILVVVTIFRGWTLYQISRGTWQKGGLSKKTLIILNTFAMAMALVAAVIIAYKEENGIVIGMIGLLGFWFISLGLAKLFRAFGK